MVRAKTDEHNFASRESRKFSLKVFATCFVNTQLLIRVPYPLGKNGSLLLRLRCLSVCLQAVLTGVGLRQPVIVQHVLFRFSVNSPLHSVFLKNSEHLFQVGQSRALLNCQKISLRTYLHSRKLISVLSCRCPL